MGMMRSSMFGITRIFCKEESRITNQWLSTLQGHCLEVTWREPHSAQSCSCELEVLGSHPQSSSPRKVLALDIRVGTSRNIFSLPCPPLWLPGWSQHRGGTSILKPSKWVAFERP